MTPKTLLCLMSGPAPAGWEAALAGWELRRAASVAEARRLLRQQSVAVGLLLVDPRQEHEALDQFLREHWHIQWIGVLPPQALQLPAWQQLVLEHCCDYHTLPLDPARLGHIAGHVLGLAALRASAQPPVRAALQESSLTGQSAAIVRLRGQIGKVAKTSAPVLIWGESGSGKELVAQAVHAQSARAAGPFVPINCGAIPASLIQSELFGHARGAFTGAAREKRGLIESAEGGSVFLDEIGDLPMAMQANLLRFLQEKTIYRLGSTHSIAVDVRVIAASHVKLERAVAEGAFREDLYYRLAVLALDVPSLRERKDDLMPLAEHIFSAFASERAPGLRGFSVRARQAIRNHDWPGNVRELVNRVRRAMVMADGRLITPPDLGLAVLPARPDGEPLDDARIRAERHAIDASLLRAGRNVSLAARELGVSRMTLYRLLAKHGIPAPSRASQA